MADLNRSHLLLTRGAALLIPALHAEGFAQAGAATPAAGFDITSAASMVLGFVFLLILVLVLIAAKRRLDEQRVRESMADAAFEMEMMVAFRAPETFPAVPASPAQPPSGTSAYLPGADTAPVEPAASPVADSAPAALLTPAPAPSPLLQSGETQHERADVVAAAVLSQLRHAGMINDIDGYMELNGNPQGAAILRMKDGRRALLVPYHETEAFARRNLRRFDLLIFVGRDGKAVVVNSLENVIADRVSSRF